MKKPTFLNFLIVICVAALFGAPVICEHYRHDSMPPGWELVERDGDYGAREIGHTFVSEPGGMLFGRRGAIAKAWRHYEHDQKDARWKRVE